MEGKLMRLVSRLLAALCGALLGAALAPPATARHPAGPGGRRGRPPAARGPRPRIPRPLRRPGADREAQGGLAEADPAAAAAKSRRLLLLTMGGWQRQCPGARCSARGAPA